MSALETAIEEASGEAEKLVVYKKYIELEKKWSEPSRIQGIYERVLTEFCLNAEIWLEYLKYLDKDLRVPDVILRIYARAVRNCPWVEKIWEGYILALERAQKPWNEIVDCFEKALATGGYTSAAEGCQLWLTHAYQLR